MLKEQKGITLVALIITIIVMLILAGVSLSLVLGEGGAINEARNVEYEQEKGKLRDAINLANTTLATDYFTDTTATKTTYKTTYGLVGPTASTTEETIDLSKLITPILDNYQSSYTIKFLDADGTTEITDIDKQATGDFYLFIGEKNAAGTDFGTAIKDADSNLVFVKVKVEFDFNDSDPFTIAGPVQLKIVE